MTDNNFLEKEFDFKKAIKNPYAKILKQQITINLDESIVSYFKTQAASTGIPYQRLINLYLKDCIANNRKINLVWN